ncbi:metabotropic glutamate receptor 3-like [Gigantopelta aegis]|uniref:metabotropic glutamate receptor 3-like n=1 Tax=Gigantopelta aegis TaxID=1735272 RepID=UPI001B889961|nr:metabotropic glutamate receptor 3-like [Gigantopelta aegis]
MWFVAGTLLLSVGWLSAQKVCNTNSYCMDNNVAVLNTTNHRADSHYYIGGLFGVHERGTNAYRCSDNIRFRGLQNMMAFFWAIDYFQRKLDLREPNGIKVNNRISIGGVAFDNCLRKEEAIENIMAFQQCKVMPSDVDRRQLMAYVGPDTSSEAMPVGELLKDMYLTSISHAATSTALSDVSNYPYFLRTVPSDKTDAEAIAAILKSMLKTEFVQLVFQDDSFGRASAEVFKEEVAKRSICIVQTISTSEDSQTIIDKLMDKSSVRYVVVFGSASTAKRILRAAENDQPPGNSRPSAKHLLVFLGTSSWGTNTDVLDQTVTAANNSIVLYPAIDQTFQEHVRNFTEYWRQLKPNNVVQTPGSNNEWFVRYWEKEWGCKVNSIGSDKCDLDKQSMKDTHIDTYIPFAIIAVQSIIQGVFDASVANCSRYNLCSGLMDKPSRGWTLHRAIKGFRVGKRYFNSRPDSGDVSSDFSKYEVHQVVKGTYKKRFVWYPDDPMNRDFSTLFDMRYYPGTTCPPPCNQCKRVQTTLPPRQISTTTTTEMTTTMTMDPTEGGKYIFFRFPRDQEMTGAYPSSSMSSDRDMIQMRFNIGQKWVIALIVLACLGIFAVLVFEAYIVYKMLIRGHRQQWRTMWLGQLLLLGILLCYLTLFAYIPVPTKATCGITRFGVGVSYAFCFAVLLVKLMVILTSKSSEPSLLPGDIESPNYLRGIYQVFMFLFALGVQVVIDTQWLITIPPEAIQVYTNNGTMEWICNHYTWSANDGYLNMTTFVRTEFENHLLSLVYIMFLILITTLLALNAHGIITNHRESIFIGIAAGFSIPIWLAWTLLGGLTKDQKMAHEFGDACLAFGLFLTTTLILFSMFLPKVRQLVNMGVEGIYFEDDQETYYAGSVIVPPSYKSRQSSGIYVNSQGIYSEPVILGNGDLSASHTRHTGSSLHGGSNPHYYKKSQSEYAPHSKVLRVTPDLTGKHTDRRTQSEIAYGNRSAKGTLKRSRYGSQQNLGAL